MPNRLNQTVFKLSPTEQTALLLTTAGIFVGYFIDHFGILNFALHILLILAILVKTYILD